MRYIKSKMFYILLLLGASVLGLSYSALVLTTSGVTATKIMVSNILYGVSVFEEGSNAPANGKTITVPANSEKDVYVTVYNVNKVESKYVLAYSGNVTVEVSDRSSWNPSGGVSEYENYAYGKTVKIKVSNETNTSQNVEFSAFGGYASNSLQNISIDEGYSAITDVTTETLVGTRSLHEIIDGDLNCSGNNTCLYGADIDHNYIRISSEDDYLYRIIGIYYINGRRAVKITPIDHSNVNDLSVLDSEKLISTTYFNCTSTDKITVTCTSSESVNIGDLTNDEWNVTGKYLNQNSKVIYIDHDTTVLGNGTTTDPYRIGYTVTFNYNGGSGNVVSKTVVDGEELGSLPEGEKTGYTFSGWTLNGVMVDSQTLETISSDQTLVAVYSPNTYTITLNNKNATSAGTASLYETYDNKYAYTSGGAAVTTITKPVKTGYNFLGYYTTEETAGTQCINASGTITCANNTFADNTVLYARWQLKSIECEAGEYLAAGSDTCTVCPAGSYCTSYSGTYDGNEHGKTACPSAYPNSASGTTTENNCYLTTTAGNYVATAGAGEVTCTAGGYCPGSVTVYKGGTNSSSHPTTGGKTNCAAGTYNASTGSSAASACTNCTGTTTYSTAGASSCSNVSSGYYATGCTSGNKCTGQTQCEANNYCTGGVKTACPTAYPNSSAGTTTVNNCYLTTTTGNYVATAGAGEVTCAAGGYCPGSVTVYKGGTHSSSHLTTGGRTTCSAGTYNASTGSSASSACSACPTNYTSSDAGSTAQNQCYLTTTAGKFVASANAAQTDCTAGGYCPGSVKVNYGSTGGRTACGANTYNANTKSTASSACTACPTAYPSSASGTTTENNCYKVTSAGYYVATAGAGQVTCAAGGYCPGNVTVYKGGTHSSSHLTTGGRTACSAGTYNASTGQSASSACSACPTNYANSAAGATAQNQCYLTTTAGKFVASANAAQTACTAGGYCPGSVKVNYGSTGGRTACGANTYNASTSSQASSACTACPTAYPSSAAGTTTADNCYLTTASAKYVATAGAGQVDCTAGGYCPGGTTVYKGGTHSSSHLTTGGKTNCTAGTYNASTKSTASSACTACPTNYGNSAAGATAQNQCYLTTTAGKWVASANAAQSACTAGGYCPGSVKVNYGSTGGRTACSAGTYNANTSSTASSACTACPTNYASSAAGATAQNQCYLTTTAGKWVASANAAQSACTAGGYCPGSVKVNYGSTGGRTACGANTYNANTSSTASSACSACPTAYPSSAAGTTTDNNCYKVTSAGYYVATAGAGQVACAAGGYCPGNVTIYKGGTHSSSHLTTGGRTACPANSYCAAGVSSATACPTAYPTSAASTTTINNCYKVTSAGYYVATAGAGQVTCAAGGYCPGSVTVYRGGTHSSSHLTTGGRTACSAGTYNASTGQSASSACKSCTAGYYCTAGSTSATQNSCTDGNYCPAGSGSQTACTTLGSFYTKSKANATVNTDCYIPAASLKGYYVKTAKTNAVTCAAGGYCPGTSNVYYNQTGGWTGCGAGKYNASTGSQASSACGSIEAGCYGTSGTTSCPAQCVASSASQAGTYSTGGASSCTTATSGNYVTAAKQNKQVTCAAGYYCKDGKIATCASLTASYTSDAGANDTTKCYLNVGAGKYKTSPTGNATANCPKGSAVASHKSYYQSPDSCPSCAANYIAASEGLSSCTACGSYMTSNSDHTACTGQVFTLTLNRNTPSNRTLSSSGTDQIYFKYNDTNGLTGFYTDQAATIPIGYYNEATANMTINIPSITNCKFWGYFSTKAYADACTTNTCNMDKQVVTGAGNMSHQFGMPAHTNNSASPQFTANQTLYARWNCPTGGTGSVTYSVYIKPVITCPSGYSACTVGSVQDGNVATHNHCVKHIGFPSSAPTSSTCPGGYTYHSRSGLCIASSVIASVDSTITSYYTSCTSSYSGYSSVSNCTQSKTITYMTNNGKAYYKPVYAASACGSGNYELIDSVCFQYTSYSTRTCKDGGTIVSTPAQYNGTCKTTNNSCPCSNLGYNGTQCSCVQN